jgi:hypothetical protein
MANSPEPARAKTTTRAFTARIIGWHWTWPVFLSSALLLVLLGAVVGVHSMFGDAPMLERNRGAVWLGPHMRTDFVLAFVSAFTFGACLAGLAKATREFDRLRRSLRLDDPKFDAYRGRLFPNIRALCVAALMGGFAGAALDLLSYFGSAIRQSHPGLHSLPFMILLFGQSQVFREVGRQHIEVDLLDPGAFSPFAAVGLMNAGFWLIGSAISSLLVASTATIWIVAAVIVVTTAFGFAGLIVPSRGLHTRIQERKREELAQIRDAIANERVVLFSEAERSHIPPKMHAMLAYEARIESVREWPFDTSTLSRFALFLLIPLASWIGGALVERAVDAALG